MDRTQFTTSLTRRGFGRGAASATLIMTAHTLTADPTRAATVVSGPTGAVEPIGETSVLQIADGRVAERPQVLGVKVYSGPGTGDLGLTVTFDGGLYTLLDQAVVTGAGEPVFLAAPRKRVSEGRSEVLLVIPSSLRSASPLEVTLGMIGPDAARAVHSKVPHATTARLGGGVARQFGRVLAAKDVTGAWSAHVGAGFVELPAVDPQVWLAPGLITIRSVGTASVPAGVRIAVNIDSRMATPGRFRTVNDSHPLKQHKVHGADVTKYMLTVQQPIQTGEYVAAAATWRPLPGAHLVDDPLPVSIDLVPHGARGTAASSLSLGASGGARVVS